VLGRLRNCSFTLSFVLALGAAGCLPGDQSTQRVPPPGWRPSPSADFPSTGTAGTIAPTAGAGGTTPIMGGMPAGTGGQPPMAGGAPAAGGGGMPGQVRTFNAGTDPRRNMVQAGKVCARLAQIQCAGEAYCCENPGRDVAACEAKMTDTCNREGFVDAITLDQRTGFDEMRAASALQQFEDMASRCDPMIGDFGADPNGLMAMVRGTVDQGGRCSPSIAGSMAQQAGALASCRDPGATACLPMSALNWTCAPRAGVGASCFSDFNCTNGNYCPNPDFQVNTNFKCLARKADGTSCGEANECLSLTCVGGTCAAATTQSAYCLQ
jgi:hypothetical protein